MITPPSLQRHGSLFVVTGAAEAGVETVLRRATNGLREWRAGISVTTRLPRPGERDGVDYRFLSDEVFTRLAATDELLEEATVRGMRYGTLRRWVGAQTRAGSDVVLVLDAPGARQVKSRCPHAVLIVIARPGLPDVRQAADSEVRYDYLIVNEQLDEAAHALRAAILAERSHCRRTGG